MYDSVTFTPNRAQEAVDQLENTETRTARINIPNPEDKVSQTDVNVPMNAMKTLADSKTSLEIETRGVRVNIPNESLEGFDDDLYFRFIPIKKEDERQAIEERAKKEEMVQKSAQTMQISILGRPMRIETNMQSRPVTLTMPLKDVLLIDELERLNTLKNLVIFVEHSDGTKELKICCS